jgi:hypothetical protein
MAIGNDYGVAITPQERRDNDANSPPAQPA